MFKYLYINTYVQHELLLELNINWGQTFFDHKRALLQLTRFDMYRYIISNRLEVSATIQEELLPYKSCSLSRTFPVRDVMMGWVKTYAMQFFIIHIGTSVYPVSRMRFHTLKQRNKALQYKRN